MFDILFEDNHLLVVNKHAGILTQPTPESPLSLQNELKAWLKQKYAKPGNVFCEPIHRLDKPVSGVVVFAKTSKALTKLNASIRAGETTKKYMALVVPMPKKPEATLEHFLAHGNHRAEVVSECDPRGQRCSLQYRVNVPYVDIELYTGRYHQIRAQMAAIECPIVGDQKYGSKQPFFPGAIALHHARFTIPHPITKEVLTFECAPKF